MQYPGMKRRGSIWWYRKQIPADVRAVYGGQREIKRSLGTSDHSEATRRYLVVAAEVEVQRMGESFHPITRYKSGSPIC